MNTGRKYFALLAEGHTPADTAGIVDVTPGFKVPKTELKSAIFVAPVVGVAGYLTVTVAGTYSVGDELRLTITSNITSRQQWRKSYNHVVEAGATSVTAIATAIAKRVAADIAAGPDTPYVSATNAAGVITITQFDDDKNGLVGYVYTDSASGTFVNVPTATVISEGQPSDLVDKGIAVGDINLASYDTVRINFHSETAIPFIDSVGATNKGIYWYGTAGEGAAFAALVNS